MNRRPIARRVLRFFLWSAAALVGLFALLGASSGFVVVPRLNEARVDRTRLDIAQLEKGLKLYQAKTGHYPDAATGFAALVDVQILDKDPRDAWGNPYRYQLVEGRPVITSFGADGLSGGEGINADISNLSSQVSVR